MYKRRLLVCLLGGVISAVLCLVGRQILFGFPAILPSTIAATLANRILLGFVIALSAWRIHYLLHGAALGLLLSLSVSIGFLPADPAAFVAYTLAGVGYGILIEWLATRVFKAPMTTA